MARHRFFLVVGLNPTLQNTFILPSLRVSQVNRVVRHRVDVAGKGANTARILTQLEEHAVQLTFCGGPTAVDYRRLCEEDSIELCCVECDVPARYCHTMIAEDDRTVTEIVEAGYRVPPEVEQAVIDLYERELARAHTVIIGGSRAPGFSDDLYAHMVERASGAGVRTVLDIRGDDLLGCLPHRPSAIKINVSEFCETFIPGLPVDEDMRPSDLPSEIFDRMIALHAESGADVVLTNGSQPVFFVSDGSVASHEPPSVPVVNTIGSGDAATAGLAAGLHRGMVLREAVGLAVACAAKNVGIEKPGTILS